MALLLVLAVTWVTLSLVVVGACVSAGRADRSAREQSLEPDPLPGVVREYRASVALEVGVSGVGRVRSPHRRVPRSRGAQHGDGLSRAARR